MMKKIGILFFALAVMLPAAGWAASFDCKKASTWVEKKICAEPELSSLDEKLAAEYQKALNAATDKESVKRGQLEWLTKIRNKCDDRECLASAYVQRRKQIATHEKDDRNEYVSTQSCSNANDCNTKGAELYKQGAFEQAITFFRKQADFATGKNDEKNLRAALNNLALANIEIGNFLFSNAWIQEAIKRYPSDKTTLFNYKTIENKLKKTKIPSSIAGTYSRYAGYGRWSTLEITELEKGKLDIHLDIVRYGLVESSDDGPAAMWDLSAHGAIVDDKVIIQYEGENDTKCKIAMKWEKIRVLAPDQNLPEQCQLGGYNTSVDGIYWKTSTQ